MAAAVVTSLPTLQRFFLSILTWLNVQDKAQLWEDVKVHLLDEKEADTENDVLHSLQEMLHEEGSSLERLGLPMPTGATPTKEKNWHVAREMQRKIAAMPLPRAIGHEWVGSSILVYIYIYTFITLHYIT